jgi:hypothetical protein
MQIVLSKALVVGEGDKQQKVSTTITTGEGDAARSIEVLDLKLEEMTGRQIQMAAREASQRKGESVRVLVTDLDFHIELAALASGVSVNALQGLPARDFVEVATTVQAFLTGSV